MLKVKLFNSWGFNYYDYGGRGMFAVIEAILDAPLRIKGGGKTVYEDRFSGAEMTVTSKGNKADKILIEAPLRQDFGGDGKAEKIIEFQFAKNAPKINRLKKDLKKLHEDGDEGVFGLFAGRKLSVEDREVQRSGFIGSASSGSSDDDTFRLGRGDDFVTGSTGRDRIDGGRDFDSVDYAIFDTFGDTDFKVTTSKGSLKVDKGKGNGKDTLKDVEGVSLGAGDDKVKSKLKSDIRVSAGSGDDTVRAGKGDDTLVGGEGSDDIRAGKGDDVVAGGTGFGVFGSNTRDRLWGEGGSDMFVLDARQGFGGSQQAIVKDFKNGTDFIGLAGAAFHEIEIDKAGKHVELSFQGQVFARIENTRPNQLGRNDFHSDIEASLQTELF